MNGDADGGFDADWLIVGSGFGGSVAALRLAELGDSVVVHEAGRRFADHEHARSTWNLRRYFWAPHLGMRGILKLTKFRDVLVATGAGVGGGSLGYANTLYVPNEDAFYGDPHWSELADWRRELAPWYATAERMLGVTRYAPKGAVDHLIERLGQDLGVPESFGMSRVGVFLGEPGVEVPDPYFQGAGPPRTGCIRCGACMVGCRVGAKNTLVKNYLWLAERAGVRIEAGRQVVDVRPLGAADGADGYLVTSERPGAWLRRRRATTRVRGIVFAGGALGTTRLLLELGMTGALPRLSDRVGELVRTNSESILAVTAPAGDWDFSRSVAISSSVYPDSRTHVEPVTYGAGGGAIGIMSTLLVGDGTRITRPLRFLRQAIRHPVRLVQVTFPRQWSRRTFLVLVMQAHDNAMRLRGRRRLIRRGISLRTEQDQARPNPTFLPIANQAAEQLAGYIGGTPQSSIFEALFNIPTTAHLLGGATIGGTPADGVVDARQRVFGYRNMLVVDGSAVPANVGVNPSLTITAMAERAIALLATEREQRGAASATSADTTPPAGL